MIETKKSFTKSIGDGSPKFRVERNKGNEHSLAERMKMNHDRKKSDLAFNGT